MDFQVRVCFSRVKKKAPGFAEGLRKDREPHEYIHILLSDNPIVKSRLFDNVSVDLIIIAKGNFQIDGSYAVEDVSVINDDFESAVTFVKERRLDGLCFIFIIFKQIIRASPDKPT